jgi:mannose-6-phosphate isomerase-like protein (cupin superfamily)
MEKKIWGLTDELFKNSLFEVHRLEYKKGYHCSEHVHANKFNAFYIESGKLLVRVWDKEDETSPSEVILNPRDFYKVPPGFYHQFQGLDDGIAYEFYWSEFESNDITRRSSGGESN